MFTGLVQNLGTITELTPVKEGLRLSIRSTLPARLFKKGASIAVDGVCLTVETYSSSSKIFTATAIPETLKKTTLGQGSVGAHVNLEAPLTLQTPLGGHLVSGHVDTTGKILRSPPALRIQIASSLSRYLARKGSVTVNGVSLTVVGVTKDSFEVALIPETLVATNLGSLQPGDSVNIEVDLISRYLERLIPFQK